MSDLTVVRSSAPYTDLGRTLRATDVRSLLQRCRMAGLLDRVEPSAGNTRVFWSSEPSRAQLDRLGERLAEFED